ncbi:MAG: acyl-CoA/acyl-ACP dehydrogenase [Pseudomonadales bacterium]|nr:acyl-CoA/acyl-ACP dehydrogenase [Pseudomonadales bacterium]
MEFSFSEEQVQIKDLANQILRDNCTDDFLMSFSKSGELYSQQLWQLFAESGLLGMAIPEAYGGSGFGLTELCQMLEEQGRHVAPIPLLPSLVLGGLPIARFGSEEQKNSYLPGLAAGEKILTAAIAEETMATAMRASCTAEQTGEMWTLNGERIAVPYAEQAAAMLTIAETTEGKAVFIVEKTASGISTEYCDSANHEPLYAVTFNNTAARLLGSTGQGDEIINFMLNNAKVAACATMIGITEEALKRTAEYTSERKQFGTSISSFQNTTIKLADCYIDIECLRSTYYEAMWKLDNDYKADDEGKTAKWWACISGHRVTHIAQHLHGGIGADIEYPLHRYYIWFKQMDLATGGGNKQLAELGALLAQDNALNLLPETA